MVRGKDGPTRPRQMPFLRNIIIVYRRPLVIAVHLLLWGLALLTSCLLRFDFTIPKGVAEFLPKLLVLTLIVRTLAHWRFGLFHGLWRYSGARDLVSLLQAATISSVVIAGVWAFLATGTFPRSVLILDFAFSILFVGGVRFGIRTLREVIVQTTRGGPDSGEPRRRILIIGAGDAGEMLMREILRIYRNRYEPVGFTSTVIPTRSSPRRFTVCRCSDASPRSRTSRRVRRSTRSSSPSRR